MSETVYVLVKLKVDDCDEVSVTDIIDDMEYDFSYRDYPRLERIIETEILDWNQNGKF